jgi:hypothetical protein
MTVKVIAELQARQVGSSQEFARKYLREICIEPTWFSRQHVL